MNKKSLLLCLFSACLITWGTSCKPKQSAYKSVYEAAKERDMEENTQTNPSDSYSIPAYSASTEEVRKEKITPVYERDASGLKLYNVVIAAMLMKPNAEALKQRVENEGYNVILVQNQEGFFRVIIASSDSKNEAIAKRNQILSQFNAEGDIEMLRVKYGIPFTDWWILQREY